MAEWLNAPVLKTGVEKSIVSSNLTGPAKKNILNQLIIMVLPKGLAVLGRSLSPLIIPERKLLDFKRAMSIAKLSHGLRVVG